MTAWSITDLYSALGYALSTGLLLGLVVAIVNSWRV